MTEIWKDVVGYENIYEVSSYGRVRTAVGKTTYTERHGVRHWKQRYLKNKTPKGRDVRVSLWKDGKTKSFLVHRLVAFAFIPEIEGKTSINHKDGNPKNNHVDNLEWCNHLENNRHAFENNLISTQKETTLINKSTNKKYTFKSMTKACSFLKRNHSYIHECLKKHKKITDANGNEYKAIVKG